MSQQQPQPIFDDIRTAQPQSASVPRPPGAPIAWMQRPPEMPNVPPGLEYLSMIDGLRVEQLVSLLEAVFDWETNNKYVIKNKNGEQIYMALEETDCCMRICCGSQRSFKIHVVDNLNKEVIRLNRDFKFCAGCCWFAGCCDCCAFEVKTEAPVGTYVGSIKQAGSCWKAEYDVLNANGSKQLKLVGPCCIWDGPCCPCDDQFKIFSGDETEVGDITKVYSGFIKEMLTTADHFKINFPIDLDVRTKANLIAASILIDFMFFERKKQDDNNNK